MPCHIFKLLEMKYICIEGERRYPEDVKSIFEKVLYTTPTPTHTYTHKHEVLQRSFKESGNY